MLGRYVRELKVLTLPEAVKKMTSMNADKIGIKDRGRLREGLWADVTIFDANTVIDRATFENPHQYPVGIIVCDCEWRRDDGQWASHRRACRPGHLWAGEEVRFGASREMTELTVFTAEERS